MRIRITGTKARVLSMSAARARGAHSRLAECGHARQLFDAKHILRITFTPHTIAAPSPLYCSIYSARRIRFRAIEIFSLSTAEIILFRSR